LRVWSPLGDVHVTPASATDDPAAVGPVDVVLLGVKLYDIEVAVKALGPLLGADTAVVCSTQRNLDDKGRAQASALGEAFRNHGVRVDRIVSSPVCRCMDTASLMAVGQVESSWALVPDRDTNARVRLRELKEMVGNWRGPGTLVLVTHGFTIRPLIGIIPDQAEVVVLRPTPGIEPAAHVVGRIAAPR
jgi:broad specificity phosphatase PhoE